MKHLLLVALVATSFSSLANAADGIYASVKAGISDTKYKNSLDTRYYSGADDLDIYTNANQTKSIYPTISAAVGYDFDAISPISARAELEYTYKNKTTFQPDVTNTYIQIPGSTPVNEDNVYQSNYSNSIQSQSLMLNGYYDFKNTSKFTPYVSAGLGFTHVKNKQTNGWGETSSDSDNHFTWSAGAGVNYAVSKNVGLDLSYRYVDAGKYNFKFNHDNIDLANTTKVKLQSNEYLLGVRYNF